MENVPPAEKKLLPWQMIGICMLVLIILVQMRRAIPEHSATNQPAIDTSVTSSHETRRYNATQAIMEGLKNPQTYQEINYREFFANNPDPRRYYQATIRFKAKDASGTYVFQRLCFHFTREGDVTETFACDTY